MNKFEIRQGDCLERLREIADCSAHCCVTSPPYFGLRDYGHDGQIGLEPTPEAFVAKLVEVFREVRRVLKDDGTLWLNLGDSYNSSPPGNKTPMSRSGLHGAQTSATYRARLEETQQRQQEGRKLIAGLKSKDLIGIPWMVAFALRADGWYLRSDIIWHKPSTMPESVTDRPTKAHEYVFLLSKSERYYYDQNAIREPFKEASISRTNQNIAGQIGSFRTHAGEKSNGPMKARGDAEKGANKRSVWSVVPRGFSEAHFATYPPELIKPCILAGCPEGGTVLDPFNGAGTTGLVALRHRRNYIGLELNPEYVEMSRRRILNDSPLFNQEVA